MNIKIKLWCLFTLIFILDLSRELRLDHVDIFCVASAVGQLLSNLVANALWELDNGSALP